MNIESFVDLLKEINIPQIIVMFGGMWFFYNRIDKKIEKVNLRIDNLSTKVEDIDRRLCRIEGSLSSHGHCLFNQKNADNEAQ